MQAILKCQIAQTALEHDLAQLHEDRDFDATARVRPLKVVDVGGSCAPATVRDHHVATITRSRYREIAVSFEQPVA